MFSHPVFLAGFRPFFLIALVAGVVYPVLWALAFSGVMPLPQGTFEPVKWHAVEMFYGFGWAVLGGFLLTSSKNWVRIRGLHGGPLALAVALWAVERVGVVFFAHRAKEPLVFLILNAFGIYIIAYLVWTLVRYWKQDFYRDNWIFIVALPVFLVAKNLMFGPTTYALGLSMTVGLFRVAFTVMYERTIVQFMQNAMKVEVLSNKWFDYSVKVAALVCVFQGILPVKVAVVALTLAAILPLVRLGFWKPHVAFRNFGIGVMFVGYLGLIAHFGLSALELSGTWRGIGTLPLHTFTFLCMGLIIPSMIVRIAQGHTGRKPAFFPSDKVALWVMGAAAFFRLVATQVWPAQYRIWVDVAATLWAVCFIIIGVRVGRFMLHPRIDGKVH